MKNWFYYFIISCITLGLYADDCEDSCEEAKNFMVEFTTGYRQDQLKVDVVPSFIDANVITTNHWTNVDIVQARLAFKAETCFNTYSRAYFNYGRLVDFHHHLVSPTLVLNGSRTHHEKGRVYDTEYAFGYSAYFCEALRLTPITGYSYHRIEFECHNRVVRTTPATSAEEAAHNYNRVVGKQRTTWRAPFVGMEAELFINECLRVCVNGQYLWAHYTNHGKAREKFTQTYRYKQTGNGYGVIAYAEIGYKLFEDWEMLLTGGYQHWQIKSGTDKTTYSLSPDLETKSDINKAIQNSYEISLGMSYLF